MKRRDIIFGLPMGLATARAWADAGHGDQGVGVIITSIGPDQDNPNRTAVGIEITNDRQVDAILRSVQTNYGDAQMQRRVTVLGTTTLNAIQFLAVNGETVERLTPPDRQITVNEPYSPETYFAFGFDFGPLGQVYAEIGEF